MSLNIESIAMAPLSLTLYAEESITQAACKIIRVRLYSRGIPLSGAATALMITEVTNSIASSPIHSTKIDSQITNGENESIRSNVLRMIRIELRGACTTTVSHQHESLI